MPKSKFVEGEQRVAEKVVTDSMFGNKTKSLVALEVKRVYSERGYRNEYLVEGPDGVRGVVLEAFLQIYTTRVE